MHRFVRMGTAAMAIFLVDAESADAGCRGKNFNFCSKTFHASTACNGQDQLAAIGDNHCPRGPKNCKNCESGQNCPLIEAWEPTEITIVGVEITIIEGNTTLNYA